MSFYLKPVTTRTKKKAITFPVTTYKRNKYFSPGHLFPLSRRQTMFFIALENLSFCKKYLYFHITYTPFSIFFSPSVIRPSCKLSLPTSTNSFLSFSSKSPLPHPILTKLGFPAFLLASRQVGLSGRSVWGHRSVHGMKTCRVKETTWRNPYEMLSNREPVKTWEIQNFLKSKKKYIPLWDKMFELENYYKILKNLKYTFQNFYIL